jgi:hypothetical protein
LRRGAPFISAGDGNFPNAAAFSNCRVVDADSAANLTAACVGITVSPEAKFLSEKREIPGMPGISSIDQFLSGG